VPSLEGSISYGGFEEMRRHMEFSQAQHGRVFVIRLHDGEILHEEVERFATQHSIKAAALIAVGGADEGSRLVVGPEEGRSQPIIPMEHVLNNVHEVTGTGTIFPNEKGAPVLHMHIAAGRRTSTVTGCVRKGVRVWHVLEIILFELVDTTAVRVFDRQTGFDLLRAKHGNVAIS
jgi:predicted DNA-binding protein with PD1-like motif